MNPTAKFLKNFFWMVIIICLLFILRKQVMGQVVVQPSRQLFVPGISIRVGPATIARPNDGGKDPSRAFDSTVVQGKYNYLTWGGTTYLLGGSLTEFSGPPLRAVLSPGGSGQGFDKSGAWLASAFPLSQEESSCAAGEQEKSARQCMIADRVLGFYHAETPNAMGGVNRSMAFAASQNGGYSFYQGGQILANNGECWGGSCGEADGSVVPFNGYYYLYALRSDGENGTVVARSPLSSLGIPGSWMKYNGICTEFGCQFDSPGVGGPSTALSDQNGRRGIGSYASVWQDTNSVVLLTNPQEDGRVHISFSADGVRFTTLTEPLYAIGWAGFGTDWVFYPNAHSTVDGGVAWSKSFNLFQVYWRQGYNYTCTVKSCDWPEGAFISVRPVTVTQSTNPVIGPQVGVELSLYFNETTGDYAATDAPQTPGYVRVSGEGGLGYLMTAPPPAPQAAKRLWECQFGNGRHWIVSVGRDDPFHYYGDPNQTSYSPTGVSHACQDLTGDSAALTVQSLGWIYAERQENTRPLYSCLAGGTPSAGVSFFSNDGSCEGHLGFQSALLGYIMDK